MRENKVSQRALAALLNVTELSVWNWLACRHLPRARHLFGIQALTGIPAADWVDFECSTDAGTRTSANLSAV